MMSKYLSRHVIWGVVACVLTSFHPAIVHSQDNDAVAILKRMGDEIAGLERFIVTGDGYVDARLGEGQIIEQSVDVKMRMRKPDAMRITSRSAESTKELYFGSGVLTVYSQAENFYAQSDAPTDVYAAVDFAVNDLHLDVPMLDLASKALVKDLLEDAQSVGYLGLSRFRNNIYHHIGVRTAEVDLQFWVAAEGPPLPGKLAINSKWEGGAPRSVFFFSWETEPDFGRKPFRFEPPAGATRIEFDLGSDK